MARTPSVEPEEHQCLGKNPFSSKKLAKQALRRMRARRRKLVAYRCPHCGSYHIGGES